MLEFHLSIRPVEYAAVDPFSPPSWIVSEVREVHVWLAT